MIGTVSVAIARGCDGETVFAAARLAPLPIAVTSDHRPAVATVLYVLVTAAMLNLALVVAAALTGTIFMLERVATQGLRVPSPTHVTWSVLMLLTLPA